MQRSGSRGVGRRRAPELVGWLAALCAAAVIPASCARDARAPELGETAGVASTPATIAVGDSLVDADLAAVPKGFFLGPDGGLWLGRLFVEAEYGPRAGARVAVLTHAFWERLGGDPGMVGSSLVIDGVERIVVGVTAPGFAVPEGVDVWVPSTGS